MLEASMFSNVFCTKNTGMQVYDHNDQPCILYIFKEKVQTFKLLAFENYESAKCAQSVILCLN